MKFRSVIFIVACVLIIAACKKDNSVEFTPPTDISIIFEQDEIKLQEYLSTHFYNYEEFANPAGNFDYKIVIDTIAGDNSDKIALKDSDSFGFKTLTVKSENVGIDGSEEIVHNIYYIIARQGSGTSPTFADSTYVDYEGSLLDGTVFDSSEVPVWFSLPGLVNGFSHGITVLKSGGPYNPDNENPDGTYEVDDYGIGMIFMPSALAYYSNAQGLIPAYAPISFQIDLLAVNEADHDNDGIPSYLEDLDGNGRLNNDNTDLESENATFRFFANYLDPDDDDDGTLTIDEINLDAEGKFLSFRDTDEDGTPDHLDADS